jgi:hypothetical protein
MHSHSTFVANASPLLFRYATPRTSCADLPGHYDQDAQLWVIETEGGLLPVVQGCDSSIVDTRTVTKVRQEGDDDDLSNDDMFGGGRRGRALAELATKTDVQQESDDQFSGSGLLELETRTANNQEGIDEDWPRVLLELHTKTFAELEQDDECSFAQ